jgi:hypothetical protein
MDRRKALKNTGLLIGVTLSGSTLATLLQSCQNENRLTWSPVFFDKKGAEIISELTEMILPKTETPGAKDLKVDIFVDKMFEETLSPEDKDHVRKGYEEFSALCQQKYGASFLELSPEDRIKVVQEVDRTANKFNPSIWGSTLGKQEPLDFYRRVKQFTLVGYFTSEEIGKNVLKFDPIPGAYNGCIPYDGGNSWTL